MTPLMPILVLSLGVFSVTAHNKTFTYTKPKECDPKSNCDLVVYLEDFDSDNDYFDIKMNGSIVDRSEEDSFWIGLGFNSKKEMVTLSFAADSSHFDSL